MGKDAPGRARLEAYDANVNKNIAERIRDADIDLDQQRDLEARRAAIDVEARRATSTPGSSNDNLRAPEAIEDRKVLGGAPQKMSKGTEGSRMTPPKAQTATTSPKAQTATTPPKAQVTTTTTTGPRWTSTMTTTASG